MDISLKQSLNYIQKIRTSYNKRNVRYEKIHNLDSKILSDYVSEQFINDGFNILDHGSGYGAVTKEVCRHFRNEKINFVLQDISKHQIDRAKKELKGIFRNKTFEYTISHLSDCHFDESHFDLVFSKLVFQEMPFDKQVEELTEIKRIVKKDQFIIIWLLWLDIDFADFFRDVIRKKDTLAKLTTLVKSRFFTNIEESVKLLVKSGINIDSDVEFVQTHSMLYESKNQLDGDFNMDLSKLDVFNRYIKKRAKTESKETLRKLHYSESEDNIRFEIPQMILKIKNNK